MANKWKISKKSKFSPRCDIFGILCCQKNKWCFILINFEGLHDDLLSYMVLGRPEPYFSNALADASKTNIEANCEMDASVSSLTDNGNKYVLLSNWGK